MTSEAQLAVQATRRHFFGKAAHGLGSVALTHLLGRGLSEAAATSPPGAGSAGLPHFAARAKRVIWLFQSGGPSQLETFDPKPALARLRGQELPESIRKGQRLTTMTASQSTFPLVESAFGFKQHGSSGAWISDLLPHTASIADDIGIVRSMHTQAINHDPAVTFLQTGAEIAGPAQHGSLA